MKDYHNAYKCKICNTIIMSTSRHTLVWCECWPNGGIFVDGGFDYIRGGGDFSNVEEIMIKVR